MLVLDADPQGNLSQSLGIKNPDELEVALPNIMEQIMTGEEVDVTQGIVHHKEGLDLMPCNIDLSAVDISLVHVLSREFIMKTYVDSMREFYDYILIDCMPSLGVITINSLTASDSVLIPVQAAYLPVKGLEQLIKTICRVKKHLNPGIKFEGILTGYNQKRGRAELLQKNWKTILYLLDEAQFVDADTPPKLDLRMEELAKKRPDHPAVKAYQRYRGGPDETIRSVIMTVNARMQPFDNEELLEIFSSNEIPLGEFGTGIDGDKKTKSNLFIIIPDDDDTFNFVPGMVYTLLFQKLYRQARFFGGKLPMDVGFWLDEMANIKMPNNFDKILATCRSRGVYCVPILQSLAQLKTLFADGAWEGIVGNCDTFIYLGGNEASTYEYVSKLLGKWTIDKRTSGESKGSSGSYSQNYDVLGRELMLEYELRLLPDDECIIFVRGENPIRDKKWFPWKHEQYLEARKCGAFSPKEQKEKQEKTMEECKFVGEESLNYLKLQKDKNENIRLYELDAFSFMMMDLDEMEKKIHSTPNDKKGKAGESTITAGMIQSALHAEKEREEAERKVWFVENFDSLTLLDIYASEWIGEIRRNVIRDLLQAEAPEEVIKSIIRPELEEGQVLQKKKMWMEMEGK